MKKIALAIALAVLVVEAAPAAETRRFVLDTPASTADARATGVAVRPDGSLVPLPPLTRAAEFDEPLGLALAVEEDGTAWVGTGHPARIYRVRGDAKDLVAEIEADQVTALLVDPDGALWAATASPSALLRISSSGEVEVVSRLAQGTLWDLAWFDGTVVAAAGNPGRLLRLGAGGLELAAPIPDQHARCLAVADDTLLIGTSGEGMILRWDGRGVVGAVYDSDFTEIAALAPAPGGVVYAAGLTGDPTLGAAKRPSGNGGDSDGGVTVSTSTSAAPPQTTGGTATSEVLKVVPQGAATVVHRFQSQIADALSWSDGGLVIGTGLEGELWRVVDDTPSRLDTVDAAQVVRVAGGGSWVLTQGPVQLLHRKGTPGGAFVSPVLDAKEPARWGRVSVRATGTCSLSFRSGVTAEPDATWSVWTTPAPCGGTAYAPPPARYLQWKLSMSGRSARVDRVEVAYRQVNLPPRLTDLTVYDPAVIFLKSPPPSDRIVDLDHPQLSGIFTTLGADGSDAGPDRPGKKYYRVGFQSISWKAEDPNGDPLRFRLEVRSLDTDRWWTVRDELETLVLAVDTQALADGEYRFRVTATDAPSNPADPASDSRLSSWFTVDNAPPGITVRRDGATWLVTVDDRLSPLLTVEWNRDAAEWRQLAPEDGIMDDRHEVFRLPAESGAHTVSFRATDDHFNRATVAVEEGP